ncbi:MAG: cyclic-di-AMP receptor [Thermomicrobiaceae bacterium]|nr:cyclic-di-AMP receptor [Thermomicrobiaceae bacterium]
MKLIIAIVQDEDADNLVNALVADEFRVTRISSTGSLLRTGNTSLLIGVADHQVDAVLSVIRRVCRRRMQMAVPYSPALEPGLLYLAENFEVEVGGAIVFVLNVSRFERL